MKTKQFPIILWLLLMALLMCLTCDAQFRKAKESKADTVTIERLASVHLAAKAEAQFFAEANQLNAIGCIAQSMFTGKVADSLKCASALTIMKADLQKKLKFQSDWNEYYNFELQQIIKFINQNRIVIQRRAKAIEKELSINKAYILLNF